MRGRTPTVLVVAGAQFLAVMSTSIVSVALPTIGRDLHASTTSLEWIVDAYVLVFASLLVAGGVLGDRRGRKGLFLLGVALFGLGSLLDGLAPSVPVLLAGRVLQGLGPAVVLPSSLAIITAAFADPGERARAIGAWSASSGLGLALGPALGGTIVDAAGWRWVFLLNVPIAAALLALAARHVPRVARTPARTRFDVAGALLITIGVAAIAFALIEGRAQGWSSAPILTAAGGGGLALAAFVVWERRREEPLVDVALFARPAFTAANVAGLVVFFAFIGAIVYLSAYFQEVQGRSPTGAGLAVLPIGAALALGAPIAGRLVGHVGPRAPMVAGLVLCGGATLGLLRLEPSSSIASTWWDFALVGLGAGLCLTPMTATAVGAVAPSRAGMASAVHNAMRQVGQVLGVAVLGTLAFGRLPGGAGAGPRLDPAQAAAYVAGLHDGLWVSGLALLAAAALAAALSPRAVRPAATR